MGPHRRPLLNGLLIVGLLGVTACGGGAEQFKMGLLAVQAMPPAPMSAPPPGPPPSMPPPPAPIEEEPLRDDFRDEVPTEDVAAPVVQLRAERIEINERVQFETWKSDLRSRSRRILDEIADLLMRNQHVRKVEIQGHTAITKRRRERLRPLSQRRANAVRDYLIERGVDADRLVARGYGYKRPIADNRTPEGREANRRVEFVILEQGGSVPPADAFNSPAPPAEDFSAPAPPADDFGDDGFDDFGEDDFGDDGFDDFDDEDDF